jgi:hypothetical protein
MTSQGKLTLTNEELQTLAALLAKVSGHGADLPWPLFRFITEVTATTNVDLLVRHPAKGVLLAWRDDRFGTGWHVPGSIIRHREEVTHRIAACALDEFGCGVNADERGRHIPGEAQAVVHRSSFAAGLSRTSPARWT